MAARKQPEEKPVSAPAGNARDINGWVMPGLDYPTFRLNLLCKLMDRRTLRQLAERANCTYPEWRVLSRLGCTVGGATVRQIAEAAWADRAEVSRAVASLEARGLAARLDNPQDRRAPILFLTKSGLHLYRRVLEMRGAFHEEVMSNLAAEEREALDCILGKLAHKLQSMP